MEIELYRQHGVALEITSFKGLSLGAQHYYGKLYGYKGDKRESVELERPYRQSDIDNAAPGYSDKYREEAQRLIRREMELGWLTSGFDSKEEVIAKALEVYKDHFPQALILFECSSTSSIEPWIPLHGPESIRTLSASTRNGVRASYEQGFFELGNEFYGIWKLAVEAVMRRMLEGESLEEACGYKESEG